MSFRSRLPRALTSEPRRIRAELAFVELDWVDADWVDADWALVGPQDVPSKGSSHSVGNGTSKAFSVSEIKQ